MKKIVNKVRKFFKDDTRLAVLAFFILEFIVCSLVAGFTRYDGEYFIAKTSEMSLWDFTVMRYNTWSSRNIIEAVSAIVLRWPTTTWAFVNALIDALIAYLIIKIFVKSKSSKMVWISLAFILIYPMHEISSVGWGVGVINYTWALAMLLLGIMPIKKVFYNEKISKWKYPLYTLGLIYACNNEQVCVIAVLTYLIFAVIHILNKPKKISKFLLFQLLLTILNLIFIAKCPGNYARTLDEIENYYIDFKELGVFDKATLGIVSTINNLVIGKNLVFLAFSTILAYFVCKNYSKYSYKIVSLIPFVSTILLGFGRNIILNVFPHISIYIEAFENTRLLLFTESYFDLVNYVPIIISLLIIGSIILSLILIFKKLRNNVALVIFLIGFASRAMMGFSPTIFASSNRTFLFLDFALIIDCILIWQEYTKKQERISNRSLNKLEIFYYFLAIIQSADLLILVLVNK